MKKYVAGFIGAGNMGGSLLRAVAAAAGGESIIFCEHNPARSQAISGEVGALAADAEAVASQSRFLFLGVKPDGVSALGARIKDQIDNETVVVTMAAGVSSASVAADYGTDRVIRIMPNTPVAAGEGTVLYCCEGGVGDAEVGQFTAIMSRCGLLTPIAEKHIDAAAALTGCGPAYVYMFIEALADGAVKCGLPRAEALLYATQTVLGSARLALESGKHPGELKDAVCSPGGTTIEGVMELERNSFRYAAANAVVAAYEKTAKLKK